MTEAGYLPFAAVVLTVTGMNSFTTFASFGFMSRMRPSSLAAARSEPSGLQLTASHTCSTLRMRSSALNAMGFFFIENERLNDCPSGLHGHGLATTRFKVLVSST